MKMEMSTVLEKDGSGIYAFMMSMSTEVEEALHELASMDTGMDMDDEMGDMPDFRDFDRDGFENQLRENGAELKSFSNEVADGVRTVAMEIAFKDFQGLRAASAMALGGSEGAIGIEKLDSGDYLLHAVEQPAASEEEDAEEEAEPEMPGAEDMQAAMANAGRSMELMGKLMAHSSELSMIMKITLPGDVIEHNAHGLEGRTCVWKLNSENMMTSTGMEPHIVFDGDGVDIK
jgi:hypothetical protein